MTLLEYIFKLLESNWKFCSFGLFAEEESFIFVKIIKFLLAHQQTIYTIFMDFKEDAAQDMRLCLDESSIFDYKLP